MAMAPRPFSAPPFLLLLLLFARSSGADNTDADTPAHEAMPNDRAHPASLPHHLQAPPSLLTPSSPSGVGTGGDPNLSQRVADDDEGNGFMKGDEWRGSWGQRRRRGQGNEGRGLNEEGIATAPRQSCKDLRSKRYISDGFCTSKRPLIEAVCAEKCCGPTPAPNRHRPRNRHHKYRPHNASPVSLHRSATSPHVQPWVADYVKVWARGQNEMNSVISASVAASDDAAGDEGNEDAMEEEDEDAGDVVEWRCVEDAVRRRRVRLICKDGTRRTYHVKLVKSCKCVQRRRRRRRRRGRRKGRRRLGRIGSWASRRMGREAD